jgi:hypothetical protein
VAAGVALAGSLAAIHYFRAGLTLAHYDARAHLVVARRILDSLTPGWQQIGAVWLPLPHLLNMLPSQVDAWYRTGAAAAAISVLAMALGAGSLAALLARVTGSVVAAAAGGILLLLNPNVLYLQGTPMTEPLLFGLTLFAITATAAFVDTQSPSPTPIALARPTAPTVVGLALAAACLTRYEAWPVTAALLTLAAIVMVRRGHTVVAAFRALAPVAAWPALTILVFSMNSRWVVGAWFVSGDFFVPNNTEALGRPLVAIEQLRLGLVLLGGSVLTVAGIIGSILIGWTFIRSRDRSCLILLLALFAAAAIPVAAYVQGHPFRIRYDLPLVIASAAAAAGGIAVLWRPVQLPAAVAVIALTAWQVPPLDRTAPLVVESQREAGNMTARGVITRYLQQHYDGAAIMMSMGSLGHYMHDLSLTGFDIKNFLHEGNGEIWRFAMLQPRGHAGWLIIEGDAEGGDALHHAAQRGDWLDGFEPVAEGGGARLYRAVAP